MTPPFKRPIWVPKARISNREHTFTGYALFGVLTIYNTIIIYLTNRRDKRIVLYIAYARAMAFSQSI